MYRDDPSEEDKETETHGHVNSISVLRSYRRLGLAKKLMLLSRAVPTSLDFDFHYSKSANFFQRRQWHRFTKHLMCLCMFGNRIKRRLPYTAIPWASRLQR